MCIRDSWRSTLQPVWIARIWKTSPPSTVRWWYRRPWRPRWSCLRWFLGRHRARWGPRKCKQVLQTVWCIIVVKKSWIKRRIRIRQYSQIKGCSSASSFDLPSQGKKRERKFRALEMRWYERETQSTSASSSEQPFSPRNSRLLVRVLSLYLDLFKAQTRAKISPHSFLGLKFFRRRKRKISKRPPRRGPL